MMEEEGIFQADTVRSWGLDRIDGKDLPLDGSYNPTFGNGGAALIAYVIDTDILASHGEFKGCATQVFNSAGVPNTDYHGHGTPCCRYNWCKDIYYCLQIKTCRGESTFMHW